MAEVVREPRHLRLVAVADEERRRAGQGHHGRERRKHADLAHRLHDVGDPADGAPGRRPFAPEVTAVRRADEPENERQIERGVQEDAACRAEREHDEAADAGPDEDAEIAGGGGEAHRARERGWPCDVVEQHLTRRDPENARAPVDDEERHRVPIRSVSVTKK